MSRTEVRARIPLHRVPVNIPTNWCTVCQLTLRTEAEYSAHIQLFPTHSVKPIGTFFCPGCGNEIPLENGRFAEHWLGVSGSKKCRGSGREP